MRFSIALYAGLLTLAQTALAYSKIDAGMIRRAAEAARGETRDGQRGRVITFPPPPAFTGLKAIPDAAHPFKAPGPHDMRGPCPALNTLANHGYIPRNGSITPEQAVLGITEGFNIEYDFAKFLASTATLARGNAFIGRFSIGLEQPDIPPLPGKLDGPVAGGIAKHGRFEGDVSISRLDAALGNHIDFNKEVFADFKRYLAMFGDDGPDGPKTIVNVKTFQEYKRFQYKDDLAKDPKFSFQPSRILSTFNEVGQVLNLFANGTTQNLTISAMTSIFQKQRFAPNWFRRASPAGFDVLSKMTGSTVRGDGSDFPAGEKDENGVFIPNPNNITGSAVFCVGYRDIVENGVPRTFANTTGILKQNVDTLLDAIFKLFNDNAGCERAFPNGVPGT